MGAEPHRGVAHVLQAKHYLPTEIRLFQFGAHDIYMYGIVLFSVINTILPNANSVHCLIVKILIILQKKKTYQIIHNTYIIHR